MRKLLFIFIFLLLILTTPLFAATYYIDDAGNDGYDGASCSAGHPWLTFAKAMTVLAAGDTLYLCDGTYTTTNQYDTDSVLKITVSGTNDSTRVTVKAVNDGLAIIDGGGTRIPCRIATKSYINLEGVVCKNSDDSSVRIYSSDHINVKRVSAFDVSMSSGYGQFEIAYGHDNILEDCAGYGNGRSPFLIFEETDTIVRRCWGQWKNAYNSGPASCISVYGSNGTIVENFICTYHPSYNSSYGNSQNGIGTVCADYQPNCIGNKFYGNVAYNTPSTGFSLKDESSSATGANSIWKDTVAINSNNIGLKLSSIAGADIQNITIHSLDASGRKHFQISYLASTSSATLKNSSFINGNTYVSSIVQQASSTVTHTYNNIYDVLNCYSGTTQGTGENCETLNPSYNTSTYGKGAYLMIPTALQGQGESGADMGAEVLYRYVNGTLTGTPLWPWPMEDRIFTETGYSVTYETNGGIWKTLTGVYPSEPPPPPPTVEKASIRGGAKLSGGAICR